MRFKPIAAVAAVAVAGGLGVAACGSSDSNNDSTGSSSGGKTQVAVLLPDSKSSSRWENQDRKFLQQAFDKAGVKATIVNAEGDAAAQRTQAEQAITNGAKVLLLVNLDSGSGSAIIANANKQGVKVIDYDRLTLKGNSDYYVSFDNTKVGKLQGQGLADCMKNVKGGTVATLNGSPTDNNATLFAQGYNSVLDPLYKDGTLKKGPDQSVPDWDNQQALTIFQQILTDAGNNVDAVFAANDGLANSVISALKTAGLEPMPVSGQDATVAGIQNVLSGWQSMSVYKPIKAEADAAAKAAIALLNCEDAGALAEGNVLNNGKVDVPFIKLTPVAVTKDNIKETVIADGFRTWDELCVGDFEQYCPPADQR